MAANIGDNIIQYVPKPILEDIFSRLSPTDARAAALSCRLFAAIYRDLHPLQTESRREALAGMQKEIIVHSTQVANTCPIQNLPTYRIRYNGSNTFELFHGNDPNEVKMKFVLPSEQPIEHFITRLCLNNRKLVICYKYRYQIGMAVFNWEDLKYEKDHQINSTKTVIRFHGDTLMIVTSEELISFEPDGTILTKPLPKKVLRSEQVILHPRKTYLLFHSNQERKYNLLWNFETGRKISLIHPSEVHQECVFPVAGCGFFESNVFLSWCKNLLPVSTYEAYYDLSKMDSKEELISSRKFTLRKRLIHNVEIVSEKYLLRMGRSAALECVTIRERVRLWRINVADYNLRVLNFPIDDPYVILGDFFLKVATGEMRKIKTGDDKFICMVHSEKGPCFLTQIYDRMKISNSFVFLC